MSSIKSPKDAISCYCVILTLATLPLVLSQYTSDQNSQATYQLSKNQNYLIQAPTDHLNGQVDQLERRSTSGAQYGGSGYEGTIGGKSGTQVAISVERVKNPDDEEEEYVTDYYGKVTKRKKKKKFPIRWLRDQYPFSAYNNKKKYQTIKSLNGNKYQSGADLSGQYSSDSYEVLDPNPSTWMRIPSRPTASIKFQKHSSSTPIELLPSMAAPLPAPASLQMMEPMMSMANYEPFFNGQPARAQFMNGAGGSLMTSESQQNEYTSQQQHQQQSSPSSSYSQSGQPPQQEGFGGISLSFGNGRSISFGGGQGLTIGGRAGAISIGGKNNGGSGSSGSADNAPAASGYSETTKGGSYASGYSSKSNGYGGSGDEYVNKHPTMSVDVPRKGKTIVHANLNMPPVKLRLHSSPRIKITTGSRDPLEKPSDEELTEMEEDIFEPPEPFPKRNVTANGNETTTGNMTNGSMNETTTLSPMQLQQQNGVYPPEYNQQQYQQQITNQQPFGHYQQQFDDNPVSQQQYMQQDYRYNQQQQPNQYQNNRAHLPVQQFHPANSNYNGHNQSPNQQQQYQVPFDEPPHLLQQQHQYNQQPSVKQPPGQFVEQQQVPPNNEPFMNGQLMNGPPMSGSDDNRPAVNQWRQYSHEARQQVSQVNQQLPPQMIGDANPRFYNGAPQQQPPQMRQTMVMMTPPPPQMMMAAPTQSPNLQNLDNKDPVEFAASSRLDHVLRSTGSQSNIKQSAPLQHSQFSPSTAYQIVGRPTHQMVDAHIMQSSSSVHNPIKSVPFDVPVKSSAVQKVKLLTSGNQQQVQAQESQYVSRNAYNGGGNGYHNQDQNVRTYTFGNGGISTSYGSSGGSYQSNGGQHGSSGGGGLVPSDGFDQKHYASKVEKFDPDAHDKRERSKVILFLKPRISIHMANSSTTTKRPKNMQRLINVVTSPIMLNSTNTTHQEEEFIDPDLKAPMDVYNYGYGYGNGYTNGYSTKPTSSTTKKPKRTTTTTSTTTPAPTESESTTASTGETEGTTTTATSTTSGDDSSSTTEGSTTTVSESPSTTTSEAPSSTSTESPFTSEPTKTESKSTTEREEEENVSSETPTTTTTTERVPNITETATQIDGEEDEQQNGSSTSTTQAPEANENGSSSESNGENSAAELVAAATEGSQVVVTPPTTTTTTAKPSTAAQSNDSSNGSKTVKSRSRGSTTSTTTTSAPTTIEEIVTTTTTTPEPATSTTTPEVVKESTTSISTENEDESSMQRSSPTTTSTSSTTTSSEDLEFAAEPQSQSKRSTNLRAASGRVVKLATFESRQQPKSMSQSMPMLLNNDLIDKLMRNKTLVNLMSGQLKRVIETDKMNEQDKERLVRQVFDQMMEEKVDFSMNNVRLAVKTVSSSYRAAVAKQRKQSSQLQTASSSQVATISEDPQANKKQSLVGKTSKRLRKPIDTKGFGWRAKNGSDISKSKQESEKSIDTALNLTKSNAINSGNDQAVKPTTPSSGKQSSPIVLVLLPQEKV